MAESPQFFRYRLTFFTGNKYFHALSLFLFGSVSSASVYRPAIKAGFEMSSAVKLDCSFLALRYFRAQQSLQRSSDPGSPQYFGRNVSP